MFQVQDDRGSSPTAIPAVNHPLYGPSAQPAIALQALHFHHATITTPAVPPPSELFPWEVAGPDSFVLQARGTQQLVYNHLTREVYDACLSQLKNGKSPGPDNFPNELLKHFPDSMHALLFVFFQLCWKHSKTPLTWKRSTTLLFYKKGDRTDPANYRPIALLNTVYKFWTRIISTMLSTYCEQCGILSEPQEGFRKQKDCQRQLQYLKLVLEDAKMHKRDLCISLLDIKKAFDTVDHPRLFQILEALGIPQDAVEVIKDLHMDAYTSISTNHGMTPAIPLKRGTVQGDSLSPLLFILFLEPLLRWLQLNDRGYRCGSTSQTSPQYANALAAADDLALLSGTVQQMQLQLDKVESFAHWSGMRLVPAKCETSAVLWGTHASCPHVHALDWQIIQPLLQHLHVHGSPLACIPPDKPFRYLGVLMTLTMDWKPHLSMLLDMIATKGLAIARAPATIRQKLEMERQCITTTVAYHLAIAPFSLPQLRKLDAARARVIKGILKIPMSSPSQMLYLPQHRLGSGLVSLAPLYAQICADSLAATLNDLGRLGTMARAVLRAQMCHKGVVSLQDAPALWMRVNSHMLLRKASILTAHRLQTRFDSSWTPTSSLMDLWELITTCVAAKSLSAPMPLLQDQVACPLWREFGYTCLPFMSPDFLTMHSLQTMLHNHPQQMASFPVQRAYSLLLQLCCAECCNWTQLLASPDLAEPPYTHHVCCPLTASSAPAPLNCPADLPHMIELSHVIAMAPRFPVPAQQGCYYTVA